MTSTVPWKLEKEKTVLIAVNMQNDFGREGAQIRMENRSSPNCSRSRMNTSSKNIVTTLTGRIV